MNQSLTTTTNTPQKIDGFSRPTSEGKTIINTNKMNAQLNKSKPVYFPTELWNEIKSYIPAPEPPFVRCMDALNEWIEIVLPKLPKPVVAQQLRDWNLCMGHHTLEFEEMTDTKDNRYKRTTKKDLCEMFRYVRRKIRDDLAEWVGDDLAEWDGNPYTLKGSWNPKTNIDPAFLIAYRETYKRLKKEIKQYQQSKL